MNKILFVLLFLIFLLQPTYAEDLHKKHPKVSAVIENIKHGNINTVEDYLKDGFNPNSTFMHNALINFAIDYSQNEIFDLLIEYGASVNPTNSTLQPLYYAVIKNNPHAVEKLLNKGADQNKTYLRAKPIDIAIKRNQKEIIAIFNNYNNDNGFIIAVEPNIKSKQLSKKNIINAKIDYNNIKKDTNLIQINHIKPVNANRLKNKKYCDNCEYKKYIKILSNEQYHLYKILDKIIRANNLQYQNWRIGIISDSSNLNAQASAPNLIIIDSGLYDSIYQNDDAIAFIISHEIAHILLGHHQLILEYNYQIEQAENQIIEYKNQMAQENNNSTINNATGNYYTAIGNSSAVLAYSLMIGNLYNKINKLYQQEQILELLADSEAITIMTRAGFKNSQSIVTLNLLSRIPNIYTHKSTHPEINSRINNINEYVDLLDVNEIKNEGDNNLFNSKVLNVKKSSDKQTIILEKKQNYINNYIVESIDQKLLKKAYYFYTKDNYSMAEQYFIKAFTYNKNNFIPLIYLSYIEEYKFNINKNKKYLKNAKKWINRAFKLCKTNYYINQQKKEISTLLKNI